MTGGLFALAGFALLCLAMERHHRDALGQDLALAPRRRQLLRVCGWLALLASTWGLSSRPDWGIAWAAWGAQLPLAALAVVALATWRPRWLAAAAGAGAGLAGLLAAFGGG